MPASRVCPVPGCPRITPGGRCPEHLREQDRARGTRQQRGYDRDHDKARRRWAPRVEAGLVACWRCGERIQPGEPWDLGHDDDRTVTRGPEHANRCNRSAGGKAAHA